MRDSFISGVHHREVILNGGREMKKKNIGIRLAIKIVVLLLTVLFFATAAWAYTFEVNVETSKGRTLSGLSVYGFTEAGSYTGVNAATDVNGTAIFNSDDFQTGTCKFRVDYLGNRNLQVPV